MPKKATEATPAATIELGGETCPLAYDFNKIAETEREAGCNLLSALQNFANLSAGQLRGLVLAAIRAGDPKAKLTIAQVGELFTVGSILKITEALAASIIASVPKQDEPAAAV